MNGETPWRLQGYRAQLRTPVWDARLDLLNPQEGLLDVRVSNVLLNHCRILQFLPPGFDPEIAPTALAEVYVRGSDLIATYVESSLTHIRPQVYWRSLHGGAALAGMELILSAETSRLTSEPALWCQTQWNRCEAWQLLDAERELYEQLEEGDQRRLKREQGTSLVLLRPHQLPISVAIAIHPTDFQEALLMPLERTSGSQLRYMLFTENLEKGVIRRCRIRAWWLPREVDTSAACKVYATFLQDPLPLTV